MIVYRAMCAEERDSTLKYGKLSWTTTHKWFGTEEFVTGRVQDGKFANSKFADWRYTHLLRFEVADESLQHFSKCGYRELMLSRRKNPLIKILSIKEVTSCMD